MGSLVGKILELSPKLNEILRIAKNINTYGDYERTADFVYSCFRTLAPLTRRSKALKLDDTTIVVGRWIRLKLHGFERRVTDACEFLELISKFGDRIAECISKNKRELFVKLVSLAKELKPYDIEVKVEVPDVEIEVLRYDPPIRAEKKWVKLLRLRTYLPTIVTAFFELDGYLPDKETFNVHDLGDVVLLEDIIDYVVELYKKAEEEVNEARAHNEAVLAKMKELAFHAPRK